jgi:hypothetical protein
MAPYAADSETSDDITRNSMTGGLLALHQPPQEMAKLLVNPATSVHRRSQVRGFSHPSVRIPA